MKPQSPENSQNQVKTPHWSSGRTNHNKCMHKFRIWTLTTKIFLSTDAMFTAIDDQGLERCVIGAYVNRSTIDRLCKISMNTILVATK